jgi:opacity protein-like surface antigen
MKPIPKIAKAIALSLICGNAVAGELSAPAKNVVMPAPEPAGKSGFYIGGLGGAVWMDEESFGFEGGGTATRHSDVTWGASVPVGYRWANGVQVEFMAGYYDIEFTKQVETTPPGYYGPGSPSYTDSYSVDADGYWVPLTLNTSYRFFRDKPVSVYVGIGAGAIYNSSELHRIGPTEFDLSGSQWDFMAQAYAGVSFAVTSHIDLNLGYRYVRQFDQGAEDSQLSIIETGLVFRF